MNPSTYKDLTPGAYAGELAGDYGQVREGKLFGPEGGPTSALGDGNYYQAKRNASTARARRITEAAKLYASCLNGELDPIFLREAMNPTSEVFVEHLRRIHPALYMNESTGRVRTLRETMSVTDYQALYVDVLDRMYYGYYNAFPIVNKGLAKIHQLRDFRVVSRFLLDGVVEPLTVVEPDGTGDAASPASQRALSGPVPQNASTYPTTNTAPIQYQPKLYQAKTAVNWRAFVNDDLGIFRDLAERLAIAGNRGISKFITSQFFSSTGPSAGLYNAGYGNIVNIANGASSNNPALGSQGIMDAFKILAGMKDSTGNPIMIGTGRLKLVYGPALYATANNIMNQLSVYLSTEGGSQNAQGFPTQFMDVKNWIIQNLDLVMDPYMPIVMSAASGSIAQTAWALVVDPAGQNRPSVEVGFLNGYETPQTLQKVPNTMRMGGGVDPMLGDFQSMDSEMKIITVMGAAQIDGRGTVASTGAGA